MRRDRSFFVTFLTLLAVCSLAVTAWGQAVTGSIVGNVSDVGGAAVAGAKVTITEVNTGIARTATANEVGGYVVTYLPPGTYKVVLTCLAWKPKSAKPVPQRPEDRQSFGRLPKRV